MVKMVCPDCGQIIENKEQQCPNCGCPSEYFKVTRNTNSKKYITVCPDCGKTWNELFPSQCDNCGCPSENFIKQEVVLPSKQSSINVRSVVIIVILIVAGWYMYNNFLSNKSSYSTSSDNYEPQGSHYNSYNSAKSQSVNTKSMREISSHPWKRVISGDPYGACILEVLSFSENGNGNCREIKYAGGSAVKASNFSFSYYIEGEKVYCEGTWEYVFRGGKLYDKQNHPYKNGSSLQY